MNLPLLISCTSCGARLTIPGEMAGKKIRCRCRKCGTTLICKLPPAETNGHTPPPPEARPDGPAAPAAPAATLFHQEEEILRERARHLAKVSGRSDADADTHELLTFSLQGGRYGVATRFVCEMTRLSDFTPLPGVADHLVGVVNYRGEILAIVNLGKLLGRALTALNDLSWVVVLGDDQPRFGLLADEIHDVVQLAGGDVFPAAGVDAAAGDCLAGVTRDGLVLLDGPALLDNPRRAIDKPDDL